MTTIDLSQRLTSTGTQYRSVPLDDFEFRDTSEGGFTFEGIASTVDHPYQVRDWMGEYIETIAAGAFDRSLADPTAHISLRVNHDHVAPPLASRQGGDLIVTADPHLRFKAELNQKRHDVNDIREAVKDGHMREMSIGFRTVSDAIEWNADYTERTLTDLRLREASIVEDGANDLTSASIRSLATELQRFSNTDIDEAEVRRAIAWLTGLLPDDPTEPVEIEVLETFERTGVIASDELIALYERRHGFAA